MYIFLNFFGFIITILSFVSIFFFGALSFITFPIILSFGLMSMAIANIYDYVKTKEAKAQKEKKKDINYKKCNDLNEVRANIDKIDNELVRLIAKRSSYVKQAATFKNDTDDVKAPQRVEMVIEKVRTIAKDNNVNPDIVEVVYRNMINEFVNMELDELNNLNNQKG